MAEMFKVTDMMFLRSEPDDTLPDEGDDDNRIAFCPVGCVVSKLGSSSNSDWWEASTERPKDREPYVGFLRHSKLTPIDSTPKRARLATPVLVPAVTPQPAAGTPLLPLSDKLLTDYAAIIVKRRGGKYTNIARHSHYNDPIDRSPGRPAGSTRIWGDAPAEVQTRAIDTLVAKARERNLSNREIAHVLAIARIESGFNPDAAAGTTSATSLGQFIDSTGVHYGIAKTSPFELDINADALVRHYIDNRELAKRRGFVGTEREEMIYKYHHDGPARDFGGLKLSKEKVLPLLANFERALKFA